MILPEDITFLKESVGMCLLFVFQYVLKRKKKPLNLAVNWVGWASGRVVQLHWISKIRFWLSKFYKEALSNLSCIYVYRTHTIINHS